MTIKEAIYERHTVRKYTGREIPEETVALLNSRVAENNGKFNLAVKLVTGNSEGIMAAAKLLLGQGVNNYFILAGEDTPGLDEKLGYCGADLILYAQTLGLNTWWIGGMVSKKGAEKNLGENNLRISSVIAVGYGKTQGTRHKAKQPEQISSYTGKAPAWFKAGVDAVLHAPTALNRQAFTITGSGNKVSISYAKGSFSGIDLGIGKYHFETGAGKENFEWE